MFVGGLAHSVEKQKLKTVFTNASNIRIPLNKETEKHVGVAFIEFETLHHARQAVEQYNGVTLDGRKIRVSFSNKSTTADTTTSTRRHAAGIETQCHARLSPGRHTLFSVKLKI